MKIINYLLLNCFFIGAIHPMELPGQLSKLSIDDKQKNEDKKIQLIEKEWQCYQQLSHDYKTFIWFLKKLQHKNKIPTDVIPLLASYILASRTETGNDHIALLCHLLYCNRSGEELINSLQVPLFSGRCIDFLEKFKQYEPIRPWFLAFDGPTLQSIEKTINERFSYNNDIREKGCTWEALNSLCSLHCKPSQSLWNKALLYMAYKAKAFSPDKSSLRQNCREFTQQIISQKQGSVNAQSPYDGKTLLMFWSTGMSTSFVEWLLQNGAQKTINYKSHKNETALSLAIKYGNLEIAQLLLEGGAYPDSKALMNCLENSKITDFVQLLTSHGININESDENGNTLLINAVLKYIKREYIQTFMIIEAIVTLKNIDMNHQNKDGMTALIVAAQACTNEIVNILLTHGANPNLQDMYGNTALHRYLQRSTKPSFEVVVIFLEHGFDIDITNSDQKTIMDVARENCTQDTIHLLRAYSAGQKSMSQKNKVSDA